MARDFSPATAKGIEPFDVPITQLVRPGGAPEEDRTLSHLIDNQAASPDAYKGVRWSDAAPPRGVVFVVIVIAFYDARGNDSVQTFLLVTFFYLVVLLSSRCRRWNSNPQPFD